MVIFSIRFLPNFWGIKISIPFSSLDFLFDTIMIFSWRISISHFHNILVQYVFNRFIEKVQEEILSFQSEWHFLLLNCGEIIFSLYRRKMIDYGNGVINFWFLRFFSLMFTLCRSYSMWQRDYDDSNYSGKITYSSINQKTWSKHNFNLLWDSYFMTYEKLYLWLYVF